MLSDYEEDNIFEQSIDSSKDDSTSWSKTKQTNLSETITTSEDSLSSEVDSLWNLNAIQTNAYLLRVLSDLVKAFLDVENEIQNCLYQYTNRKVSIGNDDNNILNSISNIQENLNNDLEIVLFDRFEKKNFGEKLKKEKIFNIENSDESTFSNAEFCCEEISELPIDHTHDDECLIIKKEVNDKEIGNLKSNSENVFKNSNYYEISCSYIVELTNIKSNQKNKIVENKNYISASININNCSKKNINFIQDSNTSDSLVYTSEDDSYNSEKIINVNYDLKLKKNSDISLSKISNDKKNYLKDSTNLNNKDKFNLFESQKSSQYFNNFYFSNIESDKQIVSISIKLRTFIAKLIIILESLLNDEKFCLNNILDNNLKINYKLDQIKSNKINIEENINKLKEKRSNIKSSIVQLKLCLSEHNHNEFYLKWLKEKIKDLKEDIKRIKNIGEKNFISDEINNNTRDINVFNEYDKLNELDIKNSEEVLYNRNKFIQLHRCLKEYSENLNIVSSNELIHVDLLKTINKLKIDIEQIIMENQTIAKETSFEFQDFTQQLNCLKNIIKSNKRFMNEQIFERDVEKEQFNNSVEILNSLIKEKELSILKIKEKIEFFKCDLQYVQREKDDLQCKSYNLENKFLNVSSKLEDMKSKINFLQAKNNENYLQNENLTRNVNNLEKSLQKENSINLDLKKKCFLELDEAFLKFVYDLIDSIRKFQIKDRIKEHLDKRKIEKKAIFYRQCNKSPNNISDHNQQVGDKKFQRSKSFIRNNVKLSMPNNAMSRSKSFFIGKNDNKIIEKINTKRNNYVKMVKKLKNFDDYIYEKNDKYSFINSENYLNSNDAYFLLNDKPNSFLSDSFDFGSNLSLSDSFSSNQFKNQLDQEELDQSISFDETDYFSMSSLEADVTNQKLCDLYLDIEKCKDSEKLKHCAHIISNYLKSLIRKNNFAVDFLQSKKIESELQVNKLMELQKINKDLKKQLSTNSNGLESLQDKLNHEHLKISDLKNQLEAHKNQDFESSSLYEDLNRSIFSNKENLSYLKIQLEISKETLAQKEDELCENINKLDVLKNEYKEIVENNSELKVTNEMLLHEKKNLLAKLRKLKALKLCKNLRKP